MINLDKSQTAPASLAIEQGKANGSYGLPDVIRQLDQDFYSKCYICESNAVTSYNVEHFVSHQGNQQLKFDWANLYLSCGHCNGAKSRVQTSRLLNCADPTVLIPRKIEFRYDFSPGSKPLAVALDNAIETITTVDLLNKVHSGQTSLQQIQAGNLNKLLLQEIHDLFNALESYYYEKDPVRKDYFKTTVVSLLSRKSAFTLIKYNWIKNKSIFADFSGLLDFPV